MFIQILQLLLNKFLFNPNDRHSFPCFCTLVPGEMWNLAGVHCSSIGSFDVETRRFEHGQSKLQVVFVNLPHTTLYNASIIVPTYSSNNKGLAHTLEHLIFCGSERHPNKGYLDLIANNCFSNGTNAYTSEDHTCYTFSTCSLNGLKTVLPPFLDHVLFPVLNKTHFYNEVCQLNKERQFSGVVFCEMKAREYSEADLNDHAIKEMLYGTNSPYSVECGGKTEDISTLSLEEIVAFHSTFYTTSNITVLLTGNLHLHYEQVLLSIHQYLESIEPGKLEKRNSTDSTIQFNLKTNIEPECKLVQFPSPDESVGSISFGWKGPDILLVDEINVLDLMFKFWNENSISLFQKTFVELDKPLASSVDHEIYSFLPTSIVLFFGGVSNNEVVASEIESKLSEIVTNFDLHFTLTDFVDFLNRMIQKFLFSFENSSIDFCVQLIIPQILASFYLGATSDIVIGSNLDLIGFIVKLKEKSLDYFKNIFIKYLSNNYCQVRMVPSESMNEIVTRKYEQLLLAYKSKLTEVELNEMNVLSSQTNANLLDKNALVIDGNGITPKYCNCIYLVEDSFGQIQIVPIESQFFQFTLCIPLNGLSIELKKYLLLYQELFFQSDLSVEHFLPGGFKEREMKCDSVVKQLNEKLISFSATIGLENELFSCGFLSDHFVLNACCTEDNISFLFSSLLQLLSGIDFLEGKIVTISKNLSSDLKEVKREPEEILDFLTSRLLADDVTGTSTCQQRGKHSLDSSDNLLFEERSSCNEVYLGMFVQERLLKDATKKVGSTKQQLEKVKATILNNCSTNECILQLGIPSNTSHESIVDSFLQKWKVVFSKNSIERFKYKLPNCFKRGQNVIYKMKSATTSFLTHILPISISFEQVKQNPVDYYSLVLVCQILGATEGFLYSRIRGEGLAYRVGLTIAIFAQQLIFSIGESINPFDCLQIFHSLLQQIQHTPTDWLNEQTLSSAKSMLIYQIQENRNTPVGILTDKFKDFLSEEAFRSNYKTILTDVQVDDLIRVFGIYFVRFLERSETITITVTPDHSTEHFDLDETTVIIDSLKSFYL